jgi:hypothetical protein
MPSLAQSVIEKFAGNWAGVLFGALFIVGLNELFIYPFFTSPLAHVPGPKLNAITKWWIIWTDYNGKRTQEIHAMHRKYGPVVRIAPNELAFTGEEPMKIIYGAGTVFSKPDFYNLFIAYGSLGFL